MSQTLASIAVIGGSGFYAFPELINAKEHKVETPFGDVSGVHVGEIQQRGVAFLARHGSGHKVPPHKINYRANLWALKDIGVTQVIALNAVGGINSAMGPEMLVVPDQIIDYTYGREHTYADVISADFSHVDFTEPFAAPLRASLLEAMRQVGVVFIGSAVYGCVQGPRLETAAEIDRLERDGCDLAGMTAMPEAALARELGLDYASVCMVVNWAAGRSTAPISLEDIYAVLNRSSVQVRKVLIEAISRL